MVNPSRFPGPIFHLLAGGLMLGACFMATDLVTSPLTKKGMLIFGIGAGVLVVVIRLFSGLPEGVMFSILIMDAFVPLINRYTRPRILGRTK
jgi:electron transport complex protein RnfD